MARFEVADYAYLEVTLYGETMFKVGWIRVSSAEFCDEDIINSYVTLCSISFRSLKEHLQDKMLASALVLETAGEIHKSSHLDIFSSHKYDFPADRVTIDIRPIRPVLDVRYSH